MDVEMKATAGAGTAGAADLEMHQDVGVCELPRHSLIDVLMPATPPKPKNARVIRLFDNEEGKSEPRPAAEPAAAKSEHRPQKRNAAKAARGQSLLAAAGYLKSGAPDAEPRR